MTIEQTQTQATQDPQQLVEVPASPDPAQRPARLALYLGGVLILAGGIALYLGYDGAASTLIPVAQTPYIISGGLTGLALMAMGAVTLAVYVLLRVQADMRSELASLRAVMESMVDSMSTAGAFSAVAAPSSNGKVVVAKGTSTFHRPDCKLVARSTSARQLPREEAATKGLVACRVCAP